MIDSIKKVQLFTRMDTDMLSKHIDQNNVYMKAYSSGMTVYNQNDTCDTMDVVLSGSLVSYSLSENGSATTMFEFKTNSILGANLLFQEQPAYPLTIYCLADCRLLHIKKSAVLDFLHDYHFVMQYIQSLSQNSQGLNRRIAMFTHRTLRENILDYLRRQSTLQGTKSIVLPISKKQLSDYMGVQRPSLFRELKKMKEERIIEIENRTIRLMID